MACDWSRGLCLLSEGGGLESLCRFELLLIPASLSFSLWFIMAPHSFLFLDCFTSLLQHTQHVGAAPPLLQPPYHNSYQQRNKRLRHTPSIKGRPIQFSFCIIRIALVCIGKA